jgi:RNA polymerase sigma-70 factor (ECF subfamily)
LYRLAVNKSIDFLRTKTRKKRMGRIKSLFKEDGTEVEVPATTDLSADLEQKELERLLASVIARLPERQKTAFVLSRQEGLANAQIAEVMNLSEGAVEALITRANRHLRKLLQNYYRKNL